MSKLTAVYVEKGAASKLLGDIKTAKGWIDFKSQHSHFPLLTDCNNNYFSFHVQTNTFTMIYFIWYWTQFSILSKQLDSCPMRPGETEISLNFFFPETEKSLDGTVPQRPYASPLSRVWRGYMLRVRGEVGCCMLCQTCYFNRSAVSLSNLEQPRGLQLEQDWGKAEFL